MSAPSSPTPPVIFAAHRRAAARRRMAALQARPHAARFLAEDVAEDVIERLGFLRHEPRRALVLGDAAGVLTSQLLTRGIEVHEADPVASPAVAALDDEHPWPVQGFDLIAVLFTLETVNDLPGALIHMRRALAQGGLAIATLCGAGSLPALREIMLAADGERPSPRIHPQVDVRAGAQLLQRAGFADPVADTRGLDVRYGSLEALVNDLRAQGLGNVLRQAGPPLGKAAFGRAQDAFRALGDADGRVTEHFELLTLSGWVR